MDSILNKTVIVDYDAGNLRSVANMLTFLDVPFEISSDKDVILNADRIIFPGQGHFAQAMGNLEKKVAAYNKEQKSISDVFAF